jgi:hypothetical protein
MTLVIFVIVGADASCAGGVMVTSVGMLLLHAFIWGFFQSIKLFLQDAWGDH